MSDELITWMAWVVVLTIIVCFIDSLTQPPTR